jgi:hypothetical protein
MTSPEAVQAPTAGMTETLQRKGAIKAASPVNAEVYSSNPAACRYASIDLSMWLGTHYPIVPLQFHAEQGRRSKFLQHSVLCIGELLDLSKSVRGTIDVYIKMKDDLVQHSQPKDPRTLPADVRQWSFRRISSSPPTGDLL